MRNPCGAICNADHANAEEKARGVRVACLCVGSKGHPGPHIFDMCRRAAEDRLYEILEGAPIQ